MHPLIPIAALGAGLFAAGRWAGKALTKLEQKRRQADLDRRSSAARPAGKLAVDPKSGEYRLK